MCTCKGFGGGIVMGLLRCSEGFSTLVDDFWVAYFLKKSHCSLISWASGFHELALLQH